MKEVEEFKTNPKNKINILESTINLDQIEINQNKKREEKKYLILEDNLGKNENYNNIFINKRRNKFINNKNIQKVHINFIIKLKRFYFLMILLIISFIQITSLFNENQRNIFLKLSEITLKVNGSNFKILSDNFFQRYKPYEIYLNGSLQNIDNNFNYEKNYIFIFNIKWNISITMTNLMFQGCDKISLKNELIIPKIYQKGHSLNFIKIN